MPKVGSFKIYQVAVVFKFVLMIAKWKGFHRMPTTCVKANLKNRPQTHYRWVGMCETAVTKQHKEKLNEL